MAENIFEKVKARASVTEVVAHFGGLRFNRQGFASCPFHNEKTPSLSVKEHKGIWHCFGCDEGGSAIDFVAKFNKVEPREAAKLIADFYGIGDDPRGGNIRVDRKPVPQAPTRHEANLDAPDEISAEQRKRNADYLRRCATDRSADEYLKGRGLTAETIERFHLGYDRKLDAAIIPYSDKFEYYTARLLHPKPDEKAHKKPLEKYWGKAPLFNGAALDGAGAVFIVESQICAISVMQTGGTAVGLGGLGYAGLLLREIEKRGGCPKCVFILSLDNDDAGNTKQAQIAARLKAIGARFIERKAQGGDSAINDPNELLQADAAALAANIKAATEEANRVEVKPKTADRAQAVKDLLKQDIGDGERIFEAEFLDALGYAKIHLPAELAVFKMRTKKTKVPQKDLEKQIEEHAKKYRGQSAGTTEPPVDLCGLDLNGATLPKGWTITTEKGVRKYISSQNGDYEIVACYNAVVVTARLKNVEDGDHRLEITFDNDGKWTRLVDLLPVFSSRTALVERSKKGLRVTSETAKDLVTFLAEYEVQNKPVIPHKRSTAKVGWISATQFFPFAMGDEDIVFEEGNGGIYPLLTTFGDFEKWKEMMVTLRKNKFARFITSASFASPLLIKVRCRPFIIHNWHSSGVGKTAVLKAAISVWGDPDGIMDTLNATPVGLEQSAGVHNHLPYFIDEKQVGNENKTPLDKIIYMLGGGHGKTRGAKGGGLQNKVRWHNVVMITGEEPITSGNSKDGVQTRTVELYGKPVDDDEGQGFASKVHTISEDNYGFAGEKFIRIICEKLKADPHCLTLRYCKTHEALKAKYEKDGKQQIHLEYIAAVIMADYLAETLIFGTDEATAERESYENGCEIFENNKEQLHKDNVETAYEFTLGWLAGNGSRFEDSNFSSQPQYGKKEVSGEVTTYFIIPSFFEAALVDAGYNVAKIIKGFKDRGYIYSDTDASGASRKKFSKTINGVELQAYKIIIDKRKPKPVQQRIADLVPIEDENLPF